MQIGIPKEIIDFESRVAATPETVKRWVESGLSVSVEKGAGEASYILDQDYEKVGARIEADVTSLYGNSDLIFKVQKPSENKIISKHEIDLFKDGSFLISFLQPLINAELVQGLASRNIHSFAMDMVPRIARAQKLDALSSQANVAGYKAVLLAANSLGKMMPLMMTAAGTVSAAKVFVIGAGVAGLQAIATAKRLGAIVEGYDTRPAVKEQVESLGAKFIQLETDADTETAGGYAKELSEEDKKKGQDLIDEHARNADIIITTAQIPGRRSPVLITEEVVKNMKQGSVIVDLAAEGGGNCALTQQNQVATHFGVTIIGYTNIPSMIPAQSSQLYSRNVANLFSEVYKEGVVEINLEDDVVKGSLITYKGAVVNPMVTKV